LFFTTGGKLQNVLRVEEMALLTDEELVETLETQLPALLERHPELEMRVYATFMRMFATKQEVAAVLTELREFRAEFDASRLEVNSRFEKIDSRFEQIDSQFKQVDSRFEQIDSQFKQVDSRFEQVDSRFEQVDSRFEQIDSRFEKMDSRFEQVDSRFEKMDQRFSDLKDWVEMIIGRFQTRSGRKLEDVVAGTMRVVLGRDDIRSENVRLRQSLEDTKGLIGPAGRRYEVDILVDNSTLMVFEVKSVCEVEDVDRFGDKVALMREQHPEQAIEGVIVTMAPLNEVEARCAEWGIRLVH